MAGLILDPHRTRRVPSQTIAGRFSEIEIFSAILQPGLLTSAHWSEIFVAYIDSRINSPSAKGPETSGPSGQGAVA